MKKAEKKNKGFSLIELIVVVLIIGVIGIALAPQVMKWVDTSKINTDVNNAETLQSSVQAALADWQNDGGKLATPEGIAKYTIKNNTITAQEKASTWTIGGDATKTLQSYIVTVLGGKYPQTKYDDGGFTIVVTKEGKVTVTCAAQTPTATPTPTAPVTP